MPARKNRPDKHGLPKVCELKDLKISAAENILACKLIRSEAKEPRKDHYVSWSDMGVADKMVKRGLLRESPFATGSFYLTELFRRQFRLPEI